MNAIKPTPWIEFPGECMIYFVLMGILHLAVYVAGCLGLAVLAVRQRGTFFRRAGKFGLFTLLLLAAGSLANGVWSCLIWGRLYFSTDYVMDFFPFWPITQEFISAPFGEMRGRLLSASILQVQLVWLLFAAGTWAAVIFSYRFIRPRPSDGQGATQKPGLA
jgi:hypothetical protein